MKDHVVVITGASSGIGAELAQIVASRGAHPVLVARRQSELDAVATRCGSGALTAAADVTSREQVERARDAALARFGRIDAWVNNAGRGITRNVSDLTDHDVDEMFLVNLKSALYGMQCVLPHFKERRRGHVVNVSTMLSRWPAFPPRAAYAASKAALNTLTASLRVELRAAYPEIHVSTVYPGVVATDFGRNALHGGPDNNKLPNAQPVGEVAKVIADALEKPGGEYYTRPGMQKMLVEYVAAEDTLAAESTWSAPRA